MTPSDEKEKQKQTGKIGYIEGLRGIAALQVVLLHYVSAFLPVLARANGDQHFDWEAPLANSPFFFIIDGYSSVYLFFLMSGFVLASSFIHSSRGWISLAFKRFARLFVPVATACMLCFLFFSIFPHAKTEAAAISHSRWLVSGVSLPPKILPSLRDIFFDSMVLGYKDRSLFKNVPFVRDHLSERALDFPSWTLHIEFWGSLLVLSIACFYKRLNRRVFWFADSTLKCIKVNHLAAAI